MRKWYSNVESRHLFILCAVCVFENVKRSRFSFFCWNFGGTYFQAFLRDFSRSINLLFLYRRIHRSCLYILK
ncbi:hypothetical protein LWI28_009555 [Acer negundo]|uniref:Uncharacterized protein n=1 Tax=Acer negundo TaxID=4023 RepID=A0AAD5JW16_ACENE|nr:hypothetical protein LWI28_009555 [Acer negundo]